MHIISDSTIKAFECELYLRERADATVQKYVHSVAQLGAYLQGAEITKRNLLQYREYLLSRKKAQTVNGELTAINCYLKWSSLPHLQLKRLKIQRQPFVEESRELSKEEYKRLLQVARTGNPRLYILVMTLCSTGIRISELPYITAQAAKAGRADIRMKGKCRTVLLPPKLCKKLLSYCKSRGIKSGYVFRTRSGRPVDRSNVFHQLKKLSEKAGVAKKKVFPHNFRHLFARVFFEIEKNLAHLADVLGHSNIETTRIYVATSASVHKQILNRMRLVE